MIQNIRTASIIAANSQKGSRESRSEIGSRCERKVRCVVLALTYLSAEEWMKSAPSRWVSAGGHRLYCAAGSYRKNQRVFR